MRGARTRAQGLCGTPRIIPADAGSTVSVSIPHLVTWDHPRGCGEHLDEDIQAIMDRGSSPRMRGAHARRQYPGTYHGIIPADAGSTLVVFRVYILDVDHPRGCGEHT